MLADVLDALRCPLCAEALTLGGRSLTCPGGHSFDVARQGYANLLPGGARPGTADTPEMVRARDAFLGAGHFAPLAAALAGRLSGAGRILDAGAGTGHYLAAALAPGSTGIALDLSKHAARRAARAHPRIGAVVADLWQDLPLRAASVDAILNVFAPRNAVEYRRVLRPDGALHTVTPSSRHLGPLIAELGLLTVDDRKNERTDDTLAGSFTLASRDTLDLTADLGHAEIATLVGMGPSAHHVPADDLAERIGKLPDPFPVPLSFVLSVYR
ncbi:23S rRNA (guanine(748)-N(1))-methyltransferase [Actinomadura rubteroloni]|uniref:23S rRNA (Guanine(748)-N(1))-methyltransferase n=1 Tax=Actinomadura rubteroloni TaxID=1926885 RepID=A0A2P4UF75_9ACTN|nr:methyltransferase domain-containing protein [Actinomadura rubteroloni]POM23686.1 23S rRNA (guanine(748)-N(1))-methyltransferase [Actinomadura rubteroloni]